MKTLFRTFVILAAALLVVGGLVAFRQSSLGQTLASAGPTAAREGGPPAGFRADGPPAGARHGGEGHSPSLIGLVSVGKNLAITAVSIALVAGGARLIRLGRRDRPGPVPPEPL